MFMLAGLMGLLVAGLAVDMTGVMANTSDDGLDDFPPDDGGGDPLLPPIMPDPDDAYPDEPEGDATGGDGAGGPGDEDEAPGGDKGSVIVDGGSDPEGSSDPDVLSKTIEGGDLVDVLMGGDGNDLIHGYGGDDDLRGGLGVDTIHAGTGHDWVQGDGSYGPGGGDVIHGGAGNDSLCGQGGDDLLFGDDDDDTLLGGEGGDSLHGGAGNDWLSGNAGHDVLISGGGGDDLDGGDGDDLLIGSDDPDRVWMNGGLGNDTLMAGAGDFAAGQAGADSFVLKPVTGEIPVIADFDGREDQIVLHLPDDMTGDPLLDLHQDQDGTWLILVNGEAVGRMMQDAGLRVEDIAIERRAV